MEQQSTGEVEGSTILKVPLDGGWIRELVRRTENGPFKDLYYKDAKGKSVRSENELIKYSK
jgi:hypothetical protein